MERFLPALATIAYVAPLLGLFGTVIGMIEIFGAQQAAGQGDPAQVAHGISVALYNTAFGLMIAIVAYLFYRYFRSRVEVYILLLEQSSERFTRHLLSLLERAK
jgi:biopolymer transport protein ExbB